MQAVSSTPLHALTVGHTGFPMQQRRHSPVGHRSNWVWLCCLAAINAGVANMAYAQTKLAFLAGVEQYERDGFVPLKYAEDDARELKTELEKQGFEVVLLTGAKATKQGLERSLESLYSRSKKLKRDDIALVFLSGHGVQKEVERTIAGQLVRKEEPFFCPFDAHKNDTGTMLNLNELLRRLADDSGTSTNIVLLDACRQSADKSAKSLDGSTVEQLPAKISLFFAAQSGQKSYESDKLKHGIFTHYLLEGLRGAAADQDQEVTLQGLADYVSKRVQRDSPALLSVSSSEAQLPNFIGNLRGSVVLAKGAVLQPAISLFPPGQTLSQAEKEARKQKAEKELPNLGTQAETAFVRGKLYGANGLKFQLRSLDEDYVTYCRELASLRKPGLEDVYWERAHKLRGFLEGKTIGISSTDSVRDALTRPSKHHVLAMFERHDLFQIAPTMIRPLMALATESERRQGLQAAIDMAEHATDRGILLACCNRWQEVEWSTLRYSHACYAVIPLVLNGKIQEAVDAAYQIENEWGNGGAALLLICNTLLDEGKTAEARKIFAGRDESGQVGGMVGALPVPEFGFLVGPMSGPMQELAAHVAGRLDDEAAFSALPISELPLADRTALRLWFIEGLVRDF